MRDATRHSHLKLRGGKTTVIAGKMMPHCSFSLVAAAFILCGSNNCRAFQVVPQGPHRRHVGARTSSLHSSSSSGTDSDAIVKNASQVGHRLAQESKEIGGLAKRALDLTMKKEIDVKDIVSICDEIDAHEAIRSGVVDASFPESSVAETFNFQDKALRFGRRNMLITLMKEDYEKYVTTATFLSNRIPRGELPNVQDIPYPELNVPATSLMGVTKKGDDGSILVEDCELEDKVFEDSVLDKTLLKIFRNLVEKNTGGVKSDKPGIHGLLEQGRTFMLQEGQTPQAQHKMVSDTLGGLMTPVLPPFYRIFMSGIVPKLGTDLDGKQFGPWFYAPWLTSFITPTFFGFLVGPSTPNNRKDGQPGGLVVEKCKFLQESGCKGLCLHQCKLPAQQFFAEELGLPLTVSPNFVTQECQWSFGEVPLPPEDDPTFPKGCLVGCQSRQAMKGAYTKSALCDA
jgi:hypothetical protein